LREAVDSSLVRAFLARAITRWAGHEPFRLAAAETLWHDGESDAADSLLRDILEKIPDHVDAAALLARIRQSQGRLSEASEVMARICANPHITDETLLQSIQFIQHCQRQSIAADAGRAAIARGRASPALFALLGNLQRELGEFAAARENYHRALADGVDLNAWFVPGSLALVQKFTSRDDEDFALLQRQINNASLSPRARASSLFGAAKANDDLGDYATAAAHLRNANAIAKTLQTSTHPDWKRIAARTLATNPARRDDIVPIFIVGLPRTGTTLASVRLADQRDIRDRGELPLLPFIAQRLIDSAETRNETAIVEAANLYLTHVRQDDASSRMYIDQNPLNFLYLDFIATLFPNAHIVHCVRDRRDTALSIYQQFFANDDYGFAYDFADIAAFAAGHDDLMSHWRSTLRIPIHTLRYEDLVRDTQPTLDRLHTFIGADVAHRADAATAITSASMWQARQPIHASSIGRWRNYRDFFPELESLFGDRA
jgi:tetratricopeptide (TPR) repeat protein